MASGSRHHFGRRRLLGMGGVSVLSLFAAPGCDLLSTEPAGEDGPADDSPPDSREAPMLTERVDGGGLPPLADRLPTDPPIVEPVERTGGYGGTWRTALFGAADTSWLSRTIGYEPIMRWTADGTGVVPNLAKSFEPSDDAREFTITLHEGVKWSDGEPFTADDLVFAWNDVGLHEQLRPVPPEFMLSGDTPGEMAKVDDYIVHVTFPETHGLFEMYLAYFAGELDQHPHHYLEQFHLDYNAEAEQLAADEGFDSWIDLFLARAGIWENSELPRLQPWILTTVLGEGSRVVAERNPYYWKTDPNGRQLPYIDEVTYDVVSDEEVLLLKATSGELDFHTRHINTMSNRPVLADGRESGGYDFVTLRKTVMNEMVIQLNLTHADPAMREVFQSRDFLIGLSHAIDRQEMIEAVWQRQGEPWQAAPFPDSDFYDEEFAKQYTDHDPGEAESHLDRAGFAERDNEGFRLGPDGARISFEVAVPQPALVPFWADAMELVVGYWEAVGIDARFQAVDRSLSAERAAANRHDANVWTGDGGLLGDEIRSPYHYFPSVLGGITWAPLWSTWFTSRGADGEQPPEPAVEQMELYWQLQREASEEARNDLFRQIIQIAKEQFYVIGTVSVPEGYGVVRQNFHNVPSSIPEAAHFRTPALTHPEQYFIE